MNAEVRMILSFVQPFYGALILMCFYAWLCRRQAKDPSLKWLSLSLMVWAVPAAVQLLYRPGNYGPKIAYLCSPASNILITITAFQLLRVKEAIRHQNLEIWPKIITGTVAVASLISLVLIMVDSHGGPLAAVGVNIDAMTSLVALITLGFCVSYSFFKYGNQPLMGLTIANFIYFIWYQFYISARGGQLAENPFLVALNIVSVSTMTLIFISLTLAWGLSNASRLRFRDSESVVVIVMFVDLRGSTSWAKEIADSQYVVDFMNKFNQWILSRASEPPYGVPNAKLTGDGLMLVWEVADNSNVIKQANAVTGLGYALSSGYQSWVAKKQEFYKRVPSSLGIGVNFGPANRLSSESGIYDYSGFIVNLAAKFQDLARPDGGVVIRDDWPLSIELADKFTKRGKLFIGEEPIRVRATDGVKFLGHSRNCSTSKN